MSGTIDTPLLREIRLVEYVSTTLREVVEDDDFRPEAAKLLGLTEEELATLANREDLQFVQALRIAVHLGWESKVGDLVNPLLIEDFRNQVRFKLVFAALEGKTFANWDRFLHAFNDAIKDVAGWTQQQRNRAIEIGQSHGWIQQGPVDRSSASQDRSVTVSRPPAR